MKKELKPLPLITLIGDPSQNFYQLGLKDGQNYKEVVNQIKRLMQTPWQPLNNLLGESLPLLIKQFFKNSPEFKKNFEAYAEGLGYKKEKLALWLLLPELGSSISLWLPAFPTKLLGCSSYFLKDKTNGGIVHGRVLDFPLIGSYDKNERAVLYNFRGYPKIFCYSSAGFPYPSLTAMTDQGVTLAIHQKFTPVFNRKGIPIFELVYQLLCNCHNKRSAINFLKKKQSITTWGLYMSFKNGDVLACDIAGDELYYNEYKVKSNEILYFNNFLEKKSLKNNSYLPYGFNDFCKMRKNIATKKMNALKKLPELNEFELLKAMGTPYPQKLKQLKNWNLDTVNTSTLAISTFNIKNSSSLFIPGAAPKFYQGRHTQFTNIWDKTEHELVINPAPDTPINYINGMNSLTRTQNACYKKDSHEVYHHIQMAISYLNKLPEKNIAEFFFLVFQFLYEKNKNVRVKTLEQFKKKKGTLPPYLNDQCILFIARLEKILKTKNTTTISQIKSKQLRQIYKFEQKIPGILLHKTITPFMNINIDTLDIIYGHAR